MTQLLHNVCAIAHIESRLLKNIIVVPGQGVLLRYWRNFQELPLAGLASYEVSSKVENKSRLFKHTLTALLSAHFEVHAKCYSFLLTTVDGERYLIGGPERPWPVVNTTDTFPGKVTEPAGCTLTIEHTDPFGLLRVLDYDQHFK